MKAHSQNISRSHSWRGKTFKVEVLFSGAGVAQTIWIERNGQALLFDTGDGALRDLLNNDFDLNKLQAIYYTHGHFDHIGGLYSLLGFLRMVGRTANLIVAFPERTAEIPAIVKSFLSIYQKTTPYKIELRELKPFQKITLDDITIDPFPMMHCGSIEGGEILDRIPAYGYRITDGRESIAVSGDTGLCPELSELIKGADLAILEATYRDSSEISREMLGQVHLSEDIASEIGQLAKEFILIHKGRR